MEGDGFARTKAVINRLTDVVKCQLCFELRKDSTVIFYRSCDHFFCTNCVPDCFCPLCEDCNDKPVKLKDDKNMLSLYQCLINLKLPSRSQILAILGREELDNKAKPSEKTLATETAADETAKNQETPKLLNIDKTYGQIRPERKKANNQKEVLLKNTDKINITPKLANVEEPVIKRASRGRPAAVAVEKLSLNRNTPAKVTPSTNAKATPGGAKVTPSGNAKATPGSAKVTPAFGKVTPATAKVTPKETSSKRKVNIAKRNPKGETPLHLACKKENLSLMKDLIEAGASPNVQDNAGWTPLHDSVARGNINVIQFLLDNGAKINTPGYENVTPLHQAVSQKKMEIIKLLMSYGADCHARDIYGDTPLDVAKHFQVEEAEKILLHTSASVKPQKKSITAVEENTVIWRYGLNSDEEKKLSEFVSAYNATLINSTMIKQNVTHIVVGKGKKLEIDWATISLVYVGCWIVTFSWIEESLNEKTIIPADKHEVSQASLEGFKRSRSNKLNQLPGLFSGCHFFFGGYFENYNVNEMDIRKEELKQLVELNKGVILKRAPDPESLALEKTFPYHADSKSSVAQTSYYIIYQTGKWDPKPKYNMAHMKTLPIEWLLNCILTFRILDPKTWTVFESYLA